MATTTSMATPSGPTSARPSSARQAELTGPAPAPQALHWTLDSSLHFYRKSSLYLLVPQCILDLPASSVVSTAVCHVLLDLLGCARAP